MGDIGDHWRDFESAIVPHIKATREKRLSKFHQNIEVLRDAYQSLGIDIRVYTHHHIQLRLDGYIANYFPSTRKFFFQRPKLLTTKTVSPQDVIWAFLREAKQIEQPFKLLYDSGWRFSENKRLPSEIVEVGSYLMPQVRKDFLRLAASNYPIIEKVDPLEFEFLIAELLKDRGFDAEVTAAQKDGGKDIIAIRSDAGKRYILLVECKKWLSNNVGIDIIQRGVGVKYINQADHFMIVTTAAFTKPARQEAEKVSSELSLVDSNKLKRMLIRFDENQDG